VPTQTAAGTRAGRTMTGGRGRERAAADPKDKPNILLVTHSPRARRACHGRPRPRHRDGYLTRMVGDFNLMGNYRDPRLFKFAAALSHWHLGVFAALPSRLRLSPGLRVAAPSQAAPSYSDSEMSESSWHGHAGVPSDDDPAP
jgi:hypothetical protein